MRLLRSQSLAPDIEATVDSTLRHAFRDPLNSSVTTGRSYMADATSEHEAIFTGSLWRRPCQVSLADNPFASCYTYCDTLFNALNTLTGIAMDIGGRAGFQSASAQLSYLHQRITQAVFSDGDAQGGPEVVWTTDALWIVFACLYPCSHAVNEPVAPKAIAKLAAAMPRHVRATGGTAVAYATLLETEELDAVRALWAKFSQRPPHLCAWQCGIQPILQLLLENKGGHDLTRDKILEFRKGVDRVARAAFLVYSENGTDPINPELANHPLQGVTCPHEVRRPHIDPIFVAVGDQLEIEPRGALVGLQPFQWRHGLNLLMGAHLDGVDAVQVVRNEGGLGLRLSSASDILDAKGQPRSDKAISPLQIEADTMAFGSREAKLFGCSLQRDAWDANVDLLTPLFAHVSPPRDAEVRNRGAHGLPQRHRDLCWEKAEKLIKPATEKLADEMLKRAAATTLGGCEHLW